MKHLTERQSEILQFIDHYEGTRGYWPSIRDIQLRFHFKSTNAVMGHLRALEKKGYIGRIHGQARTFRLLHRVAPSNDEKDMPEDAIELKELPVYGNIAAGYPDQVESGGEIGRLQVDVQTAGFSRSQRSFALKVRGESMIDADIRDGDFVIIEQREPRDGDIVAALIDGETTLKRFIQKSGEPPYLKAENAAFPELYPINDLSVQGVAKAFLRSL